MNRIEITKIAYHLPAKVVTNDMLCEENPDWHMDKVFERSGVKERHIAGPNETAFDLALQAFEKLSLFPLDIVSRAECLIFCTQSEDYIMPSNSFLMHNKLKLSEEVFAFDFNSACSGYIHGLILARSLIEAGQVNNVLLFNADTYSKYIHPKDRSARVLFGDGAAVSWITRSSQNNNGIVDLICASSGAGFDKFIIPAGGCRLPKSPETAFEKSSGGTVRTLENIHMEGMAILAFVNSKVPIQIRAILKRNNLTLDDVDVFVFHQASKMVLDALTKSLGLKEEKVFMNLSRIGNTVSASLPIAIADAIEQGRIKKGDKVLISGFGVGLSWASALFEF